MAHQPVDGESIFRNIMKSMDIDPYGPEVVSAIDEYARRKMMCTYCIEFSLY